MPRSLFALLVGAAGASLGLAACEQQKTGDNAPPAPVSSAEPHAPPTPRSAGDAGAVAIGEDAAAPYNGPTIGALFMQTPVMSEMEWPKDAEKRGEPSTSIRIGYIRQGTRVPVIPERHDKPNCKDGWYELVQGGFVCGRYATLDTMHPKLKVAPHPPDLDAPLPYQYGYNVRNGTPLYKTIPSRAERLQLEPWLAPKPKPKPEPEPEPDVSTATTYASSDDLDAGSPLMFANATAASIADPFGLGDDILDAGTPWYLRKYADGGKPLVTLDELRGEGSMARRMVKGFYLALDEEVKERGRWWKTTGGMLAPYDRIYIQDKWSRFHGVWLNDASASEGDGGARKPTPDIAKHGSKAQVAIVLHYKAKKYTLTESREVATAQDEIVPRHTVLKLTGDMVRINGARYHETDEGWWMRGTDATFTDPGPAPADLAPGEKWIDVNLKTQTVVAYEGDKPVFATAMSSGRKDKDDEEKDHRTPPGTFRIREKHIAATMDGDHATDGPYSIEDVPWIMYFNGSYALHGAFWHNAFGHEKSHGCVNLAPMDAKALFDWTEPHMPQGWHGVWATAEKPGTRVIVHCGAKECKEWPEN